MPGTGASGRRPKGKDAVPDTIGMVPVQSTIHSFFRPKTAPLFQRPQAQGAASESAAAPPPPPSPSKQAASALLALIEGPGQLIFSESEDEDDEDEVPETTTGTDATETTDSGEQEPIDMDWCGDETRSAVMHFLDKEQKGKKKRRRTNWKDR